MTIRRRTRWALALLALLPAAAVGQDAPVHVRPVPAHPASIVFLCSRAKSMANVLPQMKAQLLQQIDAAADGVPTYGVLFFSPDGVRKLSDALLAPTAANRKRAAAFMAKVTATSTPGAPVLAPALAAAMSLKPQGVYLVLDGAADVARADDWAKAVARAGGAGQPPFVNCIFLSDRDPPDPATVAALKKLAAASGGELKVILKKDM